MFIFREAYLSNREARIFQTTDGVLHFAGGLVGLAFGLELLITRHFAGRFLHSAFGLLSCALDSILIHPFLLFIDNLYTGDAAAFIHQQAEDGP